jgi:hypothetical protein
MLHKIFILHSISKKMLFAFALLLALPVIIVTSQKQQIVNSHAAGTTLSFTVFLHGVGKGGDSANATSGGNANPVRTQRILSVGVFNAQNVLVQSKAVPVTFNAGAGNFTGSADFGSLGTGVYTITIRADQFLQKTAPGIQQITTSTTNQISPVYLLVGDIDNNNQVNIVDFNLLMGCYSDLTPAASCTSVQKTAADLTDDGNVNQLDYNLFIREIGNRSGETNPTVVPTKITTVAPTQIITIVPTQIVSDPSSRLFTGDFETGNFNQWQESQSTGAWSQQIVTNPKRQGTYAARFELRDGDCPDTGGTCYGERTERGADGTTTGGKEGDDRWYQWSTQFGTPFPTSHTWGVISQWHSQTDGSPPVSINVDGSGSGKWGLQIHKQSGPAQYMAVYNPWSAPLAPGTWHDIKIHIKWSASDTVGFIELWHNGTKQTFNAAPCAGQTKCMIRTLVPGGGGTYFKQGYYRDQAVNGTGVIFHDGFTAAKTEAGLGSL